jgi:hypothetical protein
MRIVFSGETDPESKGVVPAPLSHENRRGNTLRLITQSGGPAIISPIV